MTERSEALGAPGPLDPRNWARDPVLWTALLLGLLARVLPLIVFPQFECLRDECIYRTMALNILDGQGLTTSNKGWLPSPGYPYLLAWMKLGLGSMQTVKGLQIALSIVSTAFIYGIGNEIADRRTARIAAFLFALNPTMAWFTNTMWIETVYIFFLLAAVVFMLSARRRSAWQPAAWAGLMLGCAILFRGVATYLPPFWVLAAIIPTDDVFSWSSWVKSARVRWRSGLAVCVTAVMVVTPYSFYASRIHGGFLVTDATVGHVLYLGNNDFPPLTFDYGNGMLTQPIFGKYLSIGRRPCVRTAPPVQSSKCEVKEAISWAQRNPTQFASRVPLRLAQLFNPNSFLTRHVRWGYWPGIPWQVKEVLAATIICLSTALILLGTLTAWARARGPYAIMAVGTTVYTVFTIAVMYGMTRFRLPLEALWTVYLAMFLADPRGVLQALRGTDWRMAGALLTLPPLLALLLWFLPTGFPVFW